METIPSQDKNKLFKLVLIGPESTGKTTLAKRLAEHYKTSWVPEYAREYAELKLETSEPLLDSSDILPIAIGQMNLENKISKIANKILVCDTDIFVTQIYSHIYYDFSPNELDKAVKSQKHHLYLLTYIDVPWEEDKIRDKPRERGELFLIFENALKVSGNNYVLVKGNKDERFNDAVRVIDRMLVKGY